jgi:hypothetical protein
MLAVLLIGAGTALLSKSGVGVPAYVLAAFPLTVVVLVVVSLVRRSRLEELRPREAVGVGDDRARVDAQPLLQQRAVEAAEVAR